MTAKQTVSFPIPLPDDPQKWDGWSKYKSPNLYERLCLDPRANPSNELIEEHCRELMRWWQKKLPLKNQPSNPLAQLLHPGLEESSRYLTEARVELLNPERRRAMDDELAAQFYEEATQRTPQIHHLCPGQRRVDRRKRRRIYFNSDPSTG